MAVSYTHLDVYKRQAVDGASARQRFRHITVSLISPKTFFLFVYQTIGAFQLFTEPFVMTNGGPANSSLSVVQYIYYCLLYTSRCV